MNQTHVQKDQIIQDTAAVLVARVAVDIVGTPATKSEISSISYNVYDGNTLITAGDLDVSTTIFDTLQPWDVDSIGYNFSTILPPECFPRGATVYRAQVLIDRGTAGYPLRLLWDLRSIPVAGI